MEKDRVFAVKKKIVEPFLFDAQVTGVFDDMLNRSVPFYRENIVRQSQLAADFYQTGSRIYDLGCSHGNLGIQILRCFKDKPFQMIGVDASTPMIDRYNQRLKNEPNASQVTLICKRMEEIDIENASVVLINLTLQFLGIERRHNLIQTIFSGMKKGGVLLLTEKTVHPEPELNRLELDYYRRFKLENGYSELEISQKRDALEKVLVPDTVETHMDRLATVGFKYRDIWLKWFNFTSMIAIK